MNNQMWSQLPRLTLFLTPEVFPTIVGVNPQLPSRVISTLSQSTELQNGSRTSNDNCE
jgi:hypothetical protein